MMNMSCSSEVSRGDCYPPMVNSFYQVGDVPSQTWTGDYWIDDSTGSQKIIGTDGFIYITGTVGGIWPPEKPKRWECDYCGSQNKHKRISCKNCGAPREDK